MIHPIAPNEHAGNCRRLPGAEAKRQSLPPHPVQVGKHRKVIAPHKLVIVQLRANAIWIVASSGSAVASWPCQVGAVAYSLSWHVERRQLPALDADDFDRHRDRPGKPAEPAEPFVVSDDQFDLVRPRCGRPAGRSRASRRCRRAPVSRSGRRREPAAESAAACARPSASVYWHRPCRSAAPWLAPVATSGNSKPPDAEGLPRSGKFHPANLPIKNATRICEASLLANRDTRPYCPDHGDERRANRFSIPNLAPLACRHDSAVTSPVQDNDRGLSSMTIRRRQINNP